MKVHNYDIRQKEVLSYALPVQLQHEPGPSAMLIYLEWDRSIPPFSIQHPFHLWHRRPLYLYVSEPEVHLEVTQLQNKH